jgi:pyrroloquinoline-quinone synthase
MGDLLSREAFRAALEDAIKGREAKDASFSLAWAKGLLERKHFARWAENHFHYVGPFADYLAYIYANAPDSAEDAKDFLLQNMYEEEISDVRHTDLLIRFAEACGTTKERVEDPENMNALTSGLQGW